MSEAEPIVGLLFSSPSVVFFVYVGLFQSALLYGLRLQVQGVRDGGGVEVDCVCRLRVTCADSVLRVT